MHENQETIESRLKSLYSLSYRILGNGEDARDIVQEAYMTYRRQEDAGKLDKVENLQAWLYRVAGNLCLDQLRRRSRHSLLLKDNSGLLAGASRRTAEDEAVAGDDNERFERCLDALPPKDRLLLEFFHDGLSYTQIAAVLGIRPGTVGTKLQRIRHRLIVMLKIKVTS